MRQLSNGGGKIVRLGNKPAERRKMSYRICPYCGAALDPGEICDCKRETESQAPKKRHKKKAAPVRQHRNGQVEIGLPTNISISEYKVN